jgi:hypothetical protein
VKAQLLFFNRARNEQLMFAFLVKKKGDWIEAKNMTQPKNLSHPRSPESSKKIPEARIAPAKTMLMLISNWREFFIERLRSEMSCQP